MSSPNSSSTCSLPACVGCNLNPKPQTQTPKYEVQIQNPKCSGILGGGDQASGRVNFCGPSFEQKAQQLLRALLGALKLETGFRFFAQYCIMYYTSKHTVMQLLTILPGPLLLIRGTLGFPLNCKCRDWVQVPGV